MPFFVPFVQELHIALLVSLSTDALTNTLQLFRYVPKASNFFH